MFPNLKILCPACGSPASRSNWYGPKTLHHLHGQSVYMTVRYHCYSCGPSSSRASSGRRKLQPCSSKLFLADAPGVLASLPEPASTTWRFTNTGRILCDAAVVDFIRAMATRSSWSAMAGAINEMKSTAWCRERELPYSHLCNSMQVTALGGQLAFPSEFRLTAKCIKNLYMADFHGREEEAEA